MKKIILLLAFCLSVGNLFAQDANADKLREEGDAAMTAKNYPEVVAKYSEYLKLTNYEDESRVFNCAFAAFNAKKYDDAIKFYDMAIQKGYKADDAYVGKAMSLRSLDKAADFTATVEAGLKANAKNTNLEKLLYAYCMKKGQAAQKAGKTEEAEELFKDVLVLVTPNIKAMLCIASVSCSTMQVQKSWPMQLRSLHPILTNMQLKRKKQMLKWLKLKVTWNKLSQLMQPMPMQKRFWMPSMQQNK